MYQPEMKVHILHLRHRIFPFHPVIERARHFLDPRLASLLQDLIRLTLREDICRIGKVALLQCLSMAHQEPSPLHAPGQAVFRKPAQESPDPHRDPVKRSMLQRLTVDIVSSKQLIGSFSRENNLYFLRCLLAQEIKSDRRRIRHGLIHIILDVRKLIPVLVRSDDLCIVFHINTRREILCVLDLTVFSLIEPYRERVVHLSEISQVTGIHSAGQIGSHLYIADLMHLDGLFHHCLNVINDLLKRLFAVPCKIRFEISGDLKLTILIDKVMSRLHAEHPFEESLVCRHKLEGKIVSKSIFIKHLVKLRVFHKCLDL